MNKIALTSNLLFTEENARIAVSAAISLIDQPTILRGQLDPRSSKAHFIVQVPAVGFEYSKASRLQHVPVLEQEALHMAAHLAAGRDVHPSVADGVSRNGIIVACAGYEVETCRMVAGCAADILFALARKEYDNQQTSAAA